MLKAYGAEEMDLSNTWLGAEACVVLAEGLKVGRWLGG